MPADHAIGDLPAFHQAVRAAYGAACEGVVVTFGVVPQYPETGYGYIQYRPECGQAVLKVEGFTEKPSDALARQYLASGNYLWNSGLFMLRASTWLKAMRQSCPGIFEACQMAMQAACHDLDFIRPDAKAFANCPSDSIDYAVMEKAQNVLVAAAPFTWNDIGSWSALRGQFPPDGRGNVVRGRCELLDCENCVVISDDSHLVGVIGMTGVAVVKSGNATLVCPLEKAQQVRELIRRIESKPDAAEYL
ncbi:Alginate biosynthesis protein AlgA [bioreactor metagenome]|uniref:Alginate biosynthesis protein AlgA n=1 Tax=bioreactor metagenome TaxID=1076179 RepID=A0A645FY94_9ZZZZ